MMKAFPGAPLHTALFEPQATFDGFSGGVVKPMPLNAVPGLRRHHRLALPALARAFSRHHVEAEVVLCSSSGWAHGVEAHGAKFVYCYTPARWLYDTERYTQGWPVARPIARTLRAPLVRWDKRAASTADRYLTLSFAVKRRIADSYGIEAEVLHPPTTLDPTGPQEPVEGQAAGFYLCISRLLPYKNVGAIVAAFEQLPSRRLVIVGTGPERQQLQRRAGTNVQLIGSVSDAQLRWLYANCLAVVAAGHEDFGLSPIEAAAFGKPSAVLQWGGYLDSIVPDETGTFFAQPDPAHIAEAVDRLDQTHWCEHALRAQAARFAEPRFIARLQEIVSESMTS